MLHHRLSIVLGCLISCALLLSTASNASASDKKIGLLLVSHGSRSDAWRKMLLDIEDAVRSDVLRDGRVAGIRSAFMEYKEPSIAAQLQAFDREGYTDVILVPLLLTVSSHSFDDIPTIIGQKEDPLTLSTLKVEGIEIYHAKVRVTMSPLLDFPSVLQKNVARRVQAMSKDPAREGVVLVAYGSGEFDDEWTDLLKQIAQQVRQDTPIDCVERCWCGHIVHYQSGPTEKTIRSVLEKKQTALVVPVLVAVDEMFQEKIIGGAVKNVAQDDRIVYRHDAILPDDNVNRWVIEITHDLASKIAQ